MFDDQLWNSIYWSTFAKNYRYKLQSWFEKKFVLSITKAGWNLLTRYIILCKLDQMQYKNRVFTKLLKIMWNSWSKLRKRKTSKVYISITSHLQFEIQLFQKCRTESPFCLVRVSIKVHIVWEGHKNLRNHQLTFVLWSASQKNGGDFAKFCGLLRIYEL